MRNLSYFDDLHRKACILQSLIEVVFDRVTNDTRDDRDFVIDKLLDAAQDLSRAVTIMTMEDPEHWEGSK
ncbi:MAG: hypothetical protein WBA44_11670 [Mesorhizobium sp.]